MWNKWSCKPVNVSGLHYIEHFLLLIHYDKRTMTKKSRHYSCDVIYTIIWVHTVYDGTFDEFAWMNVKNTKSENIIWSTKFPIFLLLVHLTNCNQCFRALNKRRRRERMEVSRKDTCTCVPPLMNWKSISTMATMSIDSHVWGSAETDPEYNPRLDWAGPLWFSLREHTCTRLSSWLKTRPSKDKNLQFRGKAVLGKANIGKLLQKFLHRRNRLDS